jgi:hypothetical protein
VFYQAHAQAASRNGLEISNGFYTNYRYYQMEGLPIGSGPVESWIKQIDERVQITGARWKPERVPQILALRCAYLSGRLDLFPPLKV